MTKFKIISWILKIFITFCLIYLAIDLSAIYFILSGEVSKTFNGTPPIISAIMTMILTIGLCFVYQSVSLFTKMGFFNLKSATYISVGGYIIALTAIISFILEINAQITMNSLIMNIFLNLLLFMIGFGLIAVSEVIRKGESIQRENDLTI